MNQNTSSTVPLSDIFFRTLHFWPWILLSVAFCVSAGFYYLLRTPKVYTETASLLIKDESKGKSTSAGVDEFGDLGLFTSNTNIQNEIASLKSPDLMEEVVRRLDLTMNYYFPGSFHKVVAYGSTLPVTVSLPDYPQNSSASFKLEISPDKKYQISDFELPESVYGKEYPKEFSGVLGDTISTPAGPLIIKPSPAFSMPSDGATESKWTWGGTLFVHKIPFSSAVGSYEGRLNVSLDNNQGTVINLSITDQNVQRGDEVLATVIGVYNENWIRDKNQIAVSTSNFINDRLAVIEDELGHVDSDISTYKSENLVPDVSAAASSYLAESQALGQEIVGLNNQLQMTRYIRSYLTSDGVNDKALPTNTGVDNLDLQGQIASYNQKLLERNALVTKSSEKNPLVQNMDKELNDMRGAIVASVDNSIVNLQTQMKGLQGARGAATSRLASNPTQAKYLLSVERQQKVKESLYLFLLQKREDNELSQAFTAYNTRVIKKPSSIGPTSPKAGSIMIAAFCIGLVIPFGAVYISETSNTKVRGRKDLENLTVPMLGEIPQVGKKSSGKKLSSSGKSSKGTPPTILVEHGSRDIINEAFRVLRTNLEFSRVHKSGCNVVAVTSFNPGSGKSFVTVNLAASIALKKKRVLVIDGDMRHGSASAYVGRPSKGLSDFLAGNVSDIDSLLCRLTPPSPLGGTEGSPSTKGALSLYADILPVGSVPPNPTELLETPRFRQLIEALKPDYDYILIDCPPIEVVADAQIIDQSADRTMFVLRAGLLERSMLPVFENLYTEKKYAHMAYVLNGTRNEPGMFGGSHSYRYGYGYGYGYGYNYAQS